MNLKKNQFLKSGICAIVDRNILPEKLIRTKKITYIQIRKKNATSISLMKKIKTMKKKFNPYNIPIFVNDRIDVAASLPVLADLEGAAANRPDVHQAVALPLLNIQTVEVAACQRLRDSRGYLYRSWRSGVVVHPARYHSDGAAT